MFCRRHDGGFMSREHTLPESLGNDEIVLPPGVVCDRCNHGRLADAEQELIRFAPVGFLRILLGHTDKRGERRSYGGTTRLCRLAPRITCSSTRRTRMHGRSSVRKGRTRTSISTSQPAVPSETPGGARLRAPSGKQRSSSLTSIMVRWSTRSASTKCARWLPVELGKRFLAVFEALWPPNSEVSVTYQFQEVLGQPAMDPTTVIAGVPFITDLFLRRLDPVDRAILGWRYSIVEF